MAIVFKHRYKSDSLIGTGIIKFRPYTVASPLSISYALTNCTADSTNPTEIIAGKTYDFSFTADSGYEFPSSGTTSVSGGTIVAWDYPDSSDLTRITVAIEVTGNLTITQIASVALPQLSTPQNVSADGTTVSWDEVENATSYAVLADGESIGTVENGPTGGTLTIHFIDDGGVNGQVIINNGSPQTITGTQTKVYEGVLTFEVRSMLACDITNQTGSMVGVTEHYTQYEINGDGSATIQFYD